MGKVKTTPPAFVNMSGYSLAVFADADLVSFSSRKAVYEAIVPATATSAAFTIVVTLKGNNLTRSGDDLTGGTVTSIRRTIKGADGAIDYSGFDIDAEDLTAAAKSNTLDDDLKVWKSMFAGDDTMTGGKAGDRLQGYAGKDELKGSDGDDWLMGGPAGDVLDGGKGIDGASYFNAKGKVTAKLGKPKDNKGEAKGDSYKSIEKLEGSAFDDKLAGDGKVNTIWGLSGDDAMAGEGGGDWLSGGRGKDVLDGGKGIDGALYSDASKGVTANLAKPGKNEGDAKGDKYRSIEKLEGSRFDDRLTGDGKSNGLFAGAGNDIIEGGKGLDFMAGGTGRDRFVFREDAVESKAKIYDVIQDFSEADNDAVDLSAIDAKRFLKGKQTFTDMGMSTFTGFGGEIRHEITKDGIWIYGNVDEDTKFDFAILLQGMKVWQDDYLLLG